jgi:cytochrome c556
VKPAIDFADKFSRLGTFPMTLPIPEAALQSHLALLGKTGSGKSNGGKVIVEHLLDLKQRVCVIDPTGTWWGMRLSRDGKTASKYQVKILGGDRADLDISHTHGSMVAEAVGTSHSAVIINTRQMSVGQRTQFFTDFAQTLVRTNEGPLHLVIDEAHLFAPKGRVSDPQAGKMLAATNDLITGGRGLGLRIILISQRPQKVHNDALGSVETLVAMRLILPHDVAAIKDWIKEWADLKSGQIVVSSLPSLKTGDFWIWSPEMGILEKDRFPIARTYDSGSIKEGKAPKLKPIDIGDLQGKLAKVVEERKASDPKALQAEVARLTRELEKKPAAAPADPSALAAAEARGYERGYKAGDAVYHAFCDQMQKIGANLSSMSSVFAAAAQKLIEKQTEVKTKISESGSQSGSRIFTTDTPTRAQAAPVARKPSPSGSGDGANLPKGERAILAVAASSVNGATRVKMTVVTGYKRSSRDTYIQRLRERGFLTEQDGRLHASDAGIDALGDDFEGVMRGDELRKHVLSTLPTGESTILAHAIASYPNSVSRDSLSEVTGYKRSSRDTYIQRLSGRELVDTTRDGVKASEDLFG